MTPHLILRKAGPLRNGAERGKGTVWHAVPGADYFNAKDALCGQHPAIMWSTGPGDAVTCPRCLKKMATSADVAKET